MALEVYCPQDIRNALLAAEQASNAALIAVGEEQNEFARGYEAGYRAALATIALAFGLIRPEGRRGSNDCQLVFLPVGGR